MKRESWVLFQFHLLSLSRWSPHLPQCQTTSVSVALVSTLATVSDYFCLSRWSPHLPVSVHSVLKCLSHCPWGYTDGTTERKHSQWLPTHSGQNSCPGTSPSTGDEPESSGERVSSVSTTTSSRDSLSELIVTVHVLFSASTRPTGQLEGRGLFSGLRLVDCWLS